MIYIIGSLVLSALTIPIMWAISGHRRYAWLVYVAFQFISGPYDIVTRQYGYAALAVILVVIGIRGWIKDAKQAVPKVREAGEGPVRHVRGADGKAAGQEEPTGTRLRFQI